MRPILTPASAGSNSGPIASRPEVEHDQGEGPAPAPAPAPAPGRGVPVGYDYDPFPRWIRSHPGLKPIDHRVLMILIGFAIWRRDSCWTTVKIIADHLDAIRPGPSRSTTASERTVQRSLGRLKAAGVIDHRRVPKPDPDQPSNGTGWRFYFLWPMILAPEGPAGGVTKGPREVTKPAKVEPEGPGSPTPAFPGVTLESGDSRVTQVRGEVRELEPTFNVALALGGEGGGPDPGHATGPGRPSEPAPSDPPTAAEARWLNVTGCTRREAAASLVKKLRDAGIDPSVEVRPEGEWIACRPRTPSIRAIPPEAGYWMRRLKPHVLANLKGEPAPAAVGEAAGGPTSGDGVGPAAPVPKAVRGDVLARIDRHPGQPGPSADGELARAIGAALRDQKPESLATFLGFAGDVRRGGMSVGLLIGAFEQACGQGMRNRGAVLIAAVKKDRKLEHEGRRSSGRGTPPAEGRP